MFSDDESSEHENVDARGIRRRRNQRSNVVPSAFDSLSGPELYDPSWYNNQLRGEFGRLGSGRMSGPVLPRSYHLRSEDLQQDDGDDDLDDENRSIRNPTGRKKPCKPMIMEVEPQKLKEDSVHGKSLVSPVTIEYENINHKPEMDTHPPKNSRKSVRFSRMIGVPPSTETVPDGEKRKSRLFRSSRFFIQSEKDGQPARNGSRSSFLKSATGTIKMRSTIGGNIAISGITRKCGMFECSCSSQEALQSFRNLLENHHLGIVISQKINEVRMQVPFGCESRTTVAYQIVVTAEDYLDGCRVIVRRSFADSLRGGNSEFEWFCSQIYEELSQVLKITRPSH